MATEETGTGPVLFAYDGSELAGLAIKEAGRQLAAGREALVVCVWQPGDVGFVVPEGRHLHAAEAPEVKKAAEETAAYGASLAEEAGFRAQSTVVEAAPTWQGIVEVAKERDASLIVLGSHTRSGLVGHLLGSVTAAVMKHCTFAVLVVRGRS
ncbi:MAG TPA: universal stress protein [Solirubrobacteraceae bacterium]|jgi:nucleotide-binding universal stress UspA family protein|nr:universal stress protein [Solirubrobacteraceae bacterium]